MGYALDCFGVYATQDEYNFEPRDLNTCRGHEEIVRSYDYHVASPGSNFFIPCFSVVTATTAGGVTPVDCDSAPSDRPCCGDRVCDGNQMPVDCAATC